MAGLGTAPSFISSPNPFGELNSVLPNLPQTNTAASGDILSKLGGQLSPGTLQQIQNGAATFATGSGMPGSNATPGSLGYNKTLQTLGLNSENQQQQGLSDYNSFIPTVSGTQTVSPALSNEISTQNAVDASAPDPSTVASYAQQLYNQYLNKFSNPAGGTGTAKINQPTQPGAFQYNPTTGGQPGSASFGYGANSLPTSVGGPAGQTVQGGSVVGDNSSPYTTEQWLRDTFGISPSAGLGADPANEAGGNG